MDHTSEQWTEGHQSNSEPDFYGKWIDIEAREPPHGKSVLVGHVDHDIVGHAKLYSDFWVVCASNDRFSKTDVTHWMEKPPSPQSA